MNRDDIIRMAREAGIGPIYGANDESLERFAYLVAAAERKACENLWEVLRISDGQIAFHIQAAIEAERKAIEPIVFGLCISDNNAQEIVNAIRERNNA